MSIKLLKLTLWITEQFNIITSNDRNENLFGEWICLASNLWFDNMYSQKQDLF